MPRSKSDEPRKPEGGAGRGDRFRRAALALPGASEGSHMGHADFRVDGRIFATLSYEARGFGTLKLTPEQQADFLAELPDLFEPAPGGWGRMGMTLLRLESVADATLAGALRTAHQNVVRKQQEQRSHRGRQRATGS